MYSDKRERCMHTTVHSSEWHDAISCMSYPVPGLHSCCPQSAEVPTCHPVSILHFPRVQRRLLSLIPHKAVELGGRAIAGLLGARQPKCWCQNTMADMAHRDTLLRCRPGSDWEFTRGACDREAL